MYLPTRNTCMKDKQFSVWPYHFSVHYRHSFVFLLLQQMSQCTGTAYFGENYPRSPLNTISGLNKDKNYLVEIQAICLWKKKRLKGPKIAINVSTKIMKGI